MKSVYKPHDNFLSRQSYYKSIYSLISLSRMRIEYRLVIINCEVLTNDNPLNFAKLKFTSNLLLYKKRKKLWSLVGDYHFRPITMQENQ